MTSRKLFLLSILAAVAGCAPKQPEAAQGPTSRSVEAEVEAAIRKHLSRRSDLDMAAMDMTVQRVDVQGDTATAVVGFQVRNTPEAAMSMRYTLARQGAEWVVRPSAPAQMEHVPPQGLPPGHPPAGGPAPAPALPPGHPPVAQ